MTSNCLEAFLPITPEGHPNLICWSRKLPPVIHSTAVNQWQKGFSQDTAFYFQSHHWKTDLLVSFCPCRAATLAIWNAVSLSAIQNPFFLDAVRLVLMALLESHANSSWWLLNNASETGICRRWQSQLPMRTIKTMKHLLVCMEIHAHLTTLET